MEKNVIVVDEQGNQYGATYPKRAKGLVKNGRARFVDDSHTKICLACPPNENLEDIKMSENIISTAVEAETAKEINAKYFLDQIEKIRQDSKHITDALENLSKVESKGPGDIGAEERAKGIADVVRCRETTNQRMIDFYAKAYSDHLAKSDEKRMEKIETVKSIWLNYLDHSASILSDDETIANVHSYVQSQINLLVMDIMADKL